MRLFFLTGFLIVSVYARTQGLQTISLIRGKSN